MNYFENLEIQIKLENNNLKIKYLQAKKNEYQRTYMEALSADYISAQKWNDKMQRISDKILILVEKNHKLRKKYIQKPVYKKVQIYTLSDFIE